MSMVTLTGLMSVLCAVVMLNQTGFEFISSVEASEPSVETEVADSSPNLGRGKILFIQCRSCHTLGSGESHMVGPNLNNVLGSEAGTKAEFGYSPAMVEADMIWSEQLLDQFLTNPAALVPGTTMAFAGIADDDDRAALIAYLLSQTQ